MPKDYIKRSPLEYMYKISVIIPSYKPQPYLFQCLNSLKTQSLPIKDYEVLLVLNGDKEPYYSEICKYLSRDLSPSFNIKFFYSDWGNVSNARNIGLDNAQGEYITFIDDDDVVSAKYLEELYENSSKNTIALSRPVAFLNTGGGISNYIIEETYNRIKHEGTLSYLKARKYFQGPCMKLFSRSVIGDRRFDTNFKNGEDALFMFLISDEFKYVKTTSEDAIYYRRIREDGAAYSRKSKLYVAHNAERLILKYCSIYFRRPLNYSFSFFITRILGAIRMCLKN